MKTLTQRSLKMGDQKIRNMPSQVICVSAGVSNTLISLWFKVKKQDSRKGKMTKNIPGKAGKNEHREGR